MAVASTTLSALSEFSQRRSLPPILPSSTGRVCRSSSHGGSFVAPCQDPPPPCALLLPSRTHTTRLPRPRRPSRFLQVSDFQGCFLWVFCKKISGSRSAGRPARYHPWYITCQSQSPRNRTNELNISTASVFSGFCCRSRARRRELGIPHLASSPHLPPPNGSVSLRMPLGARRCGHVNACLHPPHIYACLHTRACIELYI